MALRITVHRADCCNAILPTQLADALRLLGEIAVVGIHVTAGKDGGCYCMRGGDDCYPEGILEGPGQSADIHRRNKPCFKVGADAENADRIIGEVIGNEEFYSCVVWGAGIYLGVRCFCARELESDSA